MAGGPTPSGWPLAAVEAPPAPRGPPLGEDRGRGRPGWRVGGRPCTAAARFSIFVVVWMPAAISKQA
eukprot:10111326-Alexandrium_andersonii.AAC.1